MNLLKTNNQIPYAYGRHSKIYIIESDLVLKLYDSTFPPSKIITEFNHTQIINQLLPTLTATAVSLESINHQTGIILKKIDGQSYQDKFTHNPLLYFTQGQLLANIHKQILAVKTQKLPHQIDVFKPLIESTPRLTSSEKSRLLKILIDTNQNHLCHGDFHHGNIIETKFGSPIILDWMDSFAGNPKLDIALTAVNAAISDAPSHVPKLIYHLYEWLKKIIPLDNRILSFYPEFITSDINNFLLLAAGIHLARKDSNTTNHLKYFQTHFKIYPPR